MKRLFMILIATIFTLSACSLPTASDEEASEQQDEQTEAEKLLEKDLEWMEEKNEDFDLSPSDLRIMSEETGEPLGPTLAYSTEGEFDVNRYKMYGSFHGEQYLFQLGWEGPNLHHVSYERVSGPKRDAAYGDFLEHNREELTDRVGPSKDNIMWQMALADVDGDGMLEVIVYAYHYDDIDFTKHGYLSIFHFTGDDEKPFELVAYKSWFNPSSRITDNPARFNEYGEWIVEESKHDQVVMYFEDGDWYIPVSIGKNPSTAYYKDYSNDDEPDWERSYEPMPYPATCNSPYAEGTYSKKTKDKASTKEDRNEGNDFNLSSSSSSSSSSSNENETTSPEKKTKKSSISFTKEEQKLIESDPVLRKAAQSCREEANCNEGDEEDLKERAERAVIFYIERSIVARREGNFSLAEPYIYPNSPVYNDMKTLAPSDGARGVSMTYVDYDKRGVDQIDATTFDVHLRNTFDIQGTKRTGHRTFESTMRVKYDEAKDRFFVYELIDETEI